MTRHKVKPEETQEAVPPPGALPFATHRQPQDQPHFGVVDATEAGWLLVVILEERLRVVTARPATEAERARYFQEE